MIIIFFRDIQNVYNKLTTRVTHHMSTISNVFEKKNDLG